MIRPLGENVVVRMLKEDNISKGGVVLPHDIHPEALKRATVVAVGPGRHNLSGALTPIDLIPGDTVLISSYSPNTVEVDGETLYVVPNSAIFAVLV